MSNTIKCHCGGESKSPHPVGQGGCFRYHVTDPTEIPTNKRIAPPELGFMSEVWIWDIGGHWVTDYTLVNQRLYAQEESGEWTRPKSKDSINSLDA